MKTQKSRIKFLIPVLLCAAIIATLFYQKEAPTHSESSHSLQSALSEYGFGEPQQKEALEDLFKQAEIIAKDQSWETTFPSQRTEQQFTLDLLNMVKATQEKFTIRKGTQERWQVQALDWMKSDEEKLKENLKTLGFVDAIPPTAEKADAICILGATQDVMADRMRYANDLLDQGFESKTVILLAGERYVTEGIDGTEEELSALAKNLNLDDWEQLTETHLIQHAYDTSKLKQRGLPTEVIDTPRGNLPRPTTQTTIVELLQWLKQHPKIHSILFVSNQPYVHYQKSVIGSALKSQGHALSFEVVGPSVSEMNNRLLNTPQPMLEGLGSYLWAASPEVLSKMNLTVQDPTIQEQLKELYSKTPLVYEMLPKNMR